MKDSVAFGVLLFLFHVVINALSNTCEESSQPILTRSVPRNKKVKTLNGK